MWLFPIKLLFDTCFITLGALGSMTIAVISILTGDGDDDGVHERVKQINGSKTDIKIRRKHFSAGDAIQSPSKRAFSLDKTSLHASAPIVPTSSPPLKRSDSIRGPSNLHGKNACSIHGLNVIQGSHSLPSSPNKDSSPTRTSPSSYFSSYMSKFVQYLNSSEFMPSESISSINNETKRKCTCSCSSSSPSPSFTSSWEDGLGRSVRVRINKSIKDRSEIQQLERQMAKYERRRHKSGELRELRRKQQEKEQQESLRIMKHGALENGIEENRTEEKTRTSTKTIEDVRDSICAKEANLS